MSIMLIIHLSVMISSEPELLLHQYCTRMEDHSSSEGITHINRNGKEFVAYVTNQYQFDQVAGLTDTNYYQRSVAAPTEHAMKEVKQYFKCQLLILEIL